MVREFFVVNCFLNGKHHCLINFTYLLTNLLESFEKSNYNVGVIKISGNSAGDRYPRKRARPSPAVPGLRQADPAGSHERAQVEGDWKWSRVHSQRSVHIQTSQSQDSNRYSSFEKNNFIVFSKKFSSVGFLSFKKVILFWCFVTHRLKIWLSFYWQVFCQNADESKYSKHLEKEFIVWTWYLTSTWFLTSEVQFYEHITS